MTAVLEDDVALARQRLNIADAVKFANAAKDAQIAALREALNPFARAHFYYNDAGKPDDCYTGIGGVTYGDFRRAVSVLAALEMSGGVL